MRPFSIGFANILLVSLVMLASCSKQVVSPDTLTVGIEDNAQNMQVQYQVVSNTANLPCDPKRAGGECYQARLTLTFSHGLPADGWSIYLSHLAPVQSLDSEHFEIESINGDFHRLSATKEIVANHPYQIDLISDFWMVTYSDILPNYFFALENGQTRIIEATREYVDPDSGLSVIPHAGTFDSEQQIKRNGQDGYMQQTAQSLYDSNEQILQAAAQATAPKVGLSSVPRVQSQETTDSRLNISAGFALESDSLPLAPLVRAAQDLGLQLEQEGVVVVFAEDPQLQSEAYRIDIEDTLIRITASTEAGAFYGLVTLSQWAAGKSDLAIGTATDAPRYSVRSVHLDVARNFRSAQFVESLLQQMAYLKLNTLHLHLADDEGWRLAIPGLPELTEVGGFRCFDLSETQCLMPQLGSGPTRESTANGYYSEQQYQDILRTAQRLHIQVIPSLDMPGHSRAAIVAMDARYRTLMAQGETEKAELYLLSEADDTSEYRSVQHYNDNTLNPCLSATYRFVDKVLSELISLHDEAGVPLQRYHIGADETAGAWKGSPACQALIAENETLHESEDLTAYFIQKVAQMVQQKGVMPAGWSDGMETLLVDESRTESFPMQVNVWDTLVYQGQEKAYHFAQNKWHTILSFPDVFYFDFPYAASGDEPGYYWASRQTDSYKVFQFISTQMEKMASLWTDRTNHPYQANAKPEYANKLAFEGIQAHLWSEVVRHDSVAQYMYFPRLVSFADKAWHQPEWELMAGETESSTWQHAMAADWRAMSRTMVDTVLPHLVSQKINFRVPPAGGKVQGGELHMNHLFEGMTLEYRSENGAWVAYQGPVNLEAPVWIRARLPGTERISRSFKVE